MTGGEGFSAENGSHRRLYDLLRATLLRLSCVFCMFVSLQDDPLRCPVPVCGCASSGL